jgi:anti-sigma B factor antagonist
MELSRQDRDGVTIVSVQGDIDGGTAPELQDYVLAALNDNNLILLDVSGVEYMSSAGLRVLLVIYRTIDEAQGHMVLGGVSADMQGAMEATGFLRHFVLVNTFEEGLTALTS